MFTFLRGALRIIAIIVIVVLLAALVVVGIVYARAQEQVNQAQAMATRSAQELAKTQSTLKQVAAVRDETIRQLNERTQQRDSLLLQLGFKEPGAVQVLPTTQPVIVVTSAAPASTVTVKVIPESTPLPAATPASSVYSQGRQEQGQDGSIRLFVVNPEAPDQFTTRHPAIYAQTGVANTPILFTLDIPGGYYGIVGGFRIDSAGGGVYQVLPPGHVTRTITDGFALIVRSGWARDEWNFRLSQARDLGWAMAHIEGGGLQ